MRTNPLDGSLPAHRRGTLSGMDAAPEPTRTYLRRVPRWWAGKGRAANSQRRGRGAPTAPDSALIVYWKPCTSPLSTGPCPPTVAGPERHGCRAGAYMDVLAACPAMVGGQGPCSKLTHRGRGALTACGTRREPIPGDRVAASMPLHGPATGEDTALDRLLVAARRALRTNQRDWSLPARRRGTLSGMDAAPEPTRTYLRRVLRWWAGKGPAAKLQTIRSANSGPRASSAWTLRMDVLIGNAKQPAPE
ncbi:hypothetical protein GGR74_002188 [Xanthomonas arboricola]